MFACNVLSLASKQNYSHFGFFPHFLEFPSCLFFFSLLAFILSPFSADMFKNKRQKLSVKYKLLGCIPRYYYANLI